MKIALLTDIHFGARNDSLVFHQFFKKFYDECFFPYLDQNDIKTVILGGDTFDRRKYINFLTLQLCKEYFFDQIDRRGIRLIINTGNHDVFYKNTNEVNSPTLLLGNKYELVIDRPIEFKLDSLYLMVMPWITADNYTTCMEAVENTKAQVLYGHLELSGFEMYKGSVIDHGMDPKLFEKFDMVLTGHYHHKSSRQNIHYLGCPYEMTWADYDDSRGFHVLDSEDRSLTFIENPFKIFYKLWYDDRNVNTPDLAIKDLDYSKYYGCYVKIIITAKTKPAWFDIVIDRMEKAGVSDLQVVDDHLNLNLEPDEDIISQAEDTTTMLKKYITSLDNINIDRKKLEDVILKLYNEAIWTTESTQ